MWSNQHHYSGKQERERELRRPQGEGNLSSLQGKKQLPPPPPAAPAPSQLPFLPASSAQPALASLTGRVRLCRAEHPTRTGLQTLQGPPAVPRDGGGWGCVALPGPLRSGSHSGKPSKLSSTPNIPYSNPAHAHVPASTSEVLILIMFSRDSSPL